MTADALFLTPVVLAGALVQSALGFGFSLVVAPLLLLRFGAAAGIPLLVLLNLMTSAVTWWPLRSRVPGRHLLALTGGALAGMPAGFWVYLRVGEDLLRILVGVVVLAGAVGLGIRTFSTPEGTREPSSPSGPGPDLAAGAAAGVLTTSLGMPGPAVALYGSWARLPRDSMRALIHSFYVLVFGGTLLLQVVSGAAASETWSRGGLLLPGLLLGIVGGHLLASRLDDARFHALVLVVLAASAGSLLYSTVGG